MDTLPNDAGMTDDTMPAPPRLARLLGVRVDGESLTETLDLIAGWITAARAARRVGRLYTTRQIVTLNPEIVMTARERPAFRQLINRADLVVPDGIGIVWAARLRGALIRERVTGVDTVVALARLAASQGWRLFFLGAGPGTADLAAARLEMRFPGLRVVGARAASPDPADDAASVELIQSMEADVVCVAYGSPAQEVWIARNRGRLGAGVALGVGGAFDFLAGSVPRAPMWAQRAGLEWAYRLCRQPWRWRRMLALPRFAVAVVLEGVGDRA